LIDLQGKVAFVTGGASGIGLGLVRTFLKCGMRVMIADIRADHLERAAQIIEMPDRTRFLKLDVTDRNAMEAAADETLRTFGKVHVLCNNAGVGIMGDAKAATYDDWDWGIRVNLDGVFNGVHTFLPRILRHGEGGHIVNTASVSAVLPSALIYAAAKAGVLAMSEVLRSELAADGIGVTCLMPGPTASNIHEVAKLRPEHFANSGLADVEETLLARKPSADWMDPLRVGEMVVDAIRHDRAFVITHGEFKAGVVRRFEALLTGFPRTAADPSHPLGFRVANPMYDAIIDAARTTDAPFLDESESRKA